MIGTDRVEFEAVAQRVLRHFLCSIGRPAADYDVLDVVAERPSDRDASSIVAACKEMAEGPLFTATDRRFSRPILRNAMLLDQWGMPCGTLSAALPASLIRINAVACLLLARALRRDGYDEESLAILTQGISQDPYAGPLRKEAGLALRRRGEIAEAVIHLDVSMELHCSLRFDYEPHFDSPVLVMRPGPRAEIYFYRDKYYVSRRHENVVGVVPIGGELFAIRRNAAYRCIKFILHLPILRPLLLRAVHRVSAGPRRIATTAAAAAATAPASTPPVSVQPSPGWRGLAKKLATRLFAGRIEQSAGSMEEALKLAEEDR